MRHDITCFYNIISICAIVRKNSRTPILYPMSEGANECGNVGVDAADKEEGYRSESEARKEGKMR